MSVSKPAAFGVSDLQRPRWNTAARRRCVATAEEEATLAPKLASTWCRRWQMVFLGRSHHVDKRRTTKRMQQRLSSPARSSSNPGRTNADLWVQPTCDERDRHFFAGSLYRLRPRRQKIRARRPSANFCRLGGLDGCFCFSRTPLDHKRGPGLRKLGRGCSLCSPGTPER